MRQVHIDFRADGEYWCRLKPLIERYQESSLAGTCKGFLIRWLKFRFTVVARYDGKPNPAN